LSSAYCDNRGSHSVYQKVGFWLVLLFLSFLLTQLQCEASPTHWQSTFLAKIERKLIIVGSSYMPNIIWSRLKPSTVIASTASGGVTINDTLVHSAVPGAPFGGVGESGHGAYHGIHGFREFSHMRNIAEPGTMVSAYFALRFPPYSRQDPSKVQIKNRLGFKRGETIADQKVGPLRALWKNHGHTFPWTVVLAILVVLADKGAGGCLGLWWLTMRVGRLARPLIISVKGLMRRNVAGAVSS
jgi:hypothetical protein